MKALVSFTILCLVLSSTYAIASAKKKTFKYTPEQVFEAALQSATEHHVVSFIDEKHLMFTFETGHSMSSWAGFKCNVVIEPKDDGKSAEMVLNPQMKESGRHQAFSWNAGGRLADDMFHWTEEKLKVGTAAVKELARQSKREVALGPEAPRVDASPSTPESTGRPTEASSVMQPAETRSMIGSLTVISIPEAAELFIDGLSVGNAPARVQLPTGQHSIRASIKGYKEVTREIGMFPNSELKVNLVLEPDSFASLNSGSGAKQVSESRPTSNNATVSRSSDATTLSNIAADPVHMGGDKDIGSGGFLGASSEENPRVRHDGVTLSVVDPGGPADQAGIRAGDTILAVDDHYLYTAKELLAEVRNHKPGSRVHVRYRRRSAINEVDVILAREHF